MGRKIKAYKLLSIDELGDILPDKQKKVFDLLRQKKQFNEIAEILGVKEATVRQYVSIILSKIGKYCTRPTGLAFIRAINYRLRPKKQLGREFKKTGYRLKHGETRGMPIIIDEEELDNFEYEIKSPRIRTYGRTDKD